MQSNGRETAASQHRKIRTRVSTLRGKQAGKWHRNGEHHGKNNGQNRSIM